MGLAPWARVVACHCDTTRHGTTDQAADDLVAHGQKPMERSASFAAAPDEQKDISGHGGRFGPAARD